MTETPPDALDDLHAPLEPLLRDVLARAPLPCQGIALDVGCGPGVKRALLEPALGPGLRWLGLDRDRAAVRAALERGGAAHSYAGLAGDALALPLRAGCCDLICCLASLGLFADAALALREMRRVLRPRGHALLLTSAQLWAQPIAWPAPLADRLADAYAQALDAGATPLAAPADLSGALAAQLAAAGFTQIHIRAIWLDPPSASAAAHPLAHELALLPWPALRALLSAWLAPAELARCDAAAVSADIELCALALLAQARAGETA